MSFLVCVAGDDHLERELAALLRDKEMMSAVVAADPNKEVNISINGKMVQLAHISNI